MSWTPIAAPPRVAKQPPVAMSLSLAATGKRARRAHGTIVLRDPEILRLPWCALGRRVDLLFGAGEHAGYLRIVPGTAEPLKRIGSIGCGRGAGWVMIHSAPLAATLRAPAAFRGVVCEYDFGDDWIEVMIPAVARPSPAVVTAPSAAPGASKSTLPFVGVAARTGVGVAAGAGAPIR